MKRRRLGASGLEVSVLSLGAMTFGSGMPPVTTVDERDARAMIDRALAAGVNLIDTADVYAFGQSEEILGRCVRALHGRRDDVLVATKCGFGSHEAGALSYDNVVAACEASLERLGLDHIDLYQLHRPDRATPIEETLRALDDLVTRGLVRTIGTSNFRAWETSAAVARQRALDRPAFTATQVYYSLVAREAEHELIPECRADDLGVVVWSPLSSGYLTGRYRAAEGGTTGEGRRTTFTFPPVDHELGERALVALAAVADGRGVSMAQVALAWVLAQPGITSAIVGASSLEQLDDNLAAADLELTAEELVTLDAPTALAPIYPAWWDPAMGIPSPTDLLETDHLETADHLEEQL
ncbi:MAG TPA: aldo/keto reductase [Acidimicrobiia bacterium]